MSWGAICEWIEDCLEDKSFWFRLLLLFWSFRIFWFVFQNEQIPPIWNPLWVVSHGIHEIGHWITLAFGMWISVSMGSIFQFFFPFIFVWGFIKHRDPHAAFLILTWQSASLLNMAHYAGSAEYSDILLDTPHYITLYHDWVWMLTKLNAIHWARSIEDFFWFLAVLFGLISITGQVGCLYLMARQRFGSSARHWNRSVGFTDRAVIPSFQNQVDKTLKSVRKPLGSKTNREWDESPDRISAIAVWKEFLSSFSLAFLWDSSHIKFDPKRYIFRFERRSIYQ